MAPTQILRYRLGLLFVLKTLGETADCVYTPFKEVNK